MQERIRRLLAKIRPYNPGYMSAYNLQDIHRLRQAIKERRNPQKRIDPFTPPRKKI